MPMMHVGVMGMAVSQRLVRMRRWCHRSTGSSMPLCSKEAVVSSQIEGTQATLIDLLEYEAEQAIGVVVDDVHEVCNYLDAIKYTRGQIKSARGLPLSKNSS